MQRCRRRATPLTQRPAILWRFLGGVADGGATLNMAYYGWVQPVYAGKRFDLAETGCKRVRLACTDYEHLPAGCWTAAALPDGRIVPRRAEGAAMSTLSLTSRWGCTS
jgi:hypothetical protein